MGHFLDTSVSYPTAVWTALLGIVIVYWLLAIAGLVDFEHSGLDFDIEVQADAELENISTLASYVVAFGLSGVPFSVAISLIVLYAWVLSCLAGMWLLPLVPTALLGLLAGSVVLLASGALALPLTARTIRPLRRLFVTHAAISNAALVGLACKVLTGRVDQRVGRAEVSRRGASLNIRVWADTPNGLTKGSAARIVEYDGERQRYLIVPD
ncbi:MAG: ubiquinone biosynthesis protein [Aquabacterium sp.]|nr:ubiquinone biosynthesis protein [Aquabacterium sp.]